MSDNYVQSGENHGNGGSASVTLNGVVAGNALVALFLTGNRSTRPTTFSVSDGDGSYTEKSASGAGDATDNVFGEFFIRENVSSGTHVVVGTNSDSATCIIVIEIGTTANPSYADSKGADQQNPGTGTDALSSGSVSITAASTLLGVSIDVNSINTSDEPTAGTGFTSRNSGANTLIGAWRVFSEAASSSAAATATAITGTDNFLTFGIAILNAIAAIVTPIPAPLIAPHRNVFFSESIVQF